MRSTVHNIWSLLTRFLNIKIDPETLQYLNFTSDKKVELIKILSSYKFTRNLFISGPQDNMTEDQVRQYIPSFTSEIDQVSYLLEINNEISFDTNINSDKHSTLIINELEAPQEGIGLSNTQGNPAYSNPQGGMGLSITQGASAYPDPQVQPYSLDTGTRQKTKRVSFAAPGASVLNREQTSPLREEYGEQTGSATTGNKTRRDKELSLITCNNLYNSDLL